MIPLLGSEAELLLLSSAYFGSVASFVFIAAACLLVNTILSTSFCFCFFFSLRSSELKSAFHPDVAVVPGFCDSFVAELRGEMLPLEAVESLRILLVSTPSYALSQEGVAGSDRLEATLLERDWAGVLFDVMGRPWSVVCRRASGAAWPELAQPSRKEDDIA